MYIPYMCVLKVIKMLKRCLAMHTTHLKFSLTVEKLKEPERICLSLL